MKKTINTIHVLTGGETVTEKLQLLKNKIGNKDSARAFDIFIKTGYYKDEVTLAMKKCTMVGALDSLNNFADALTKLQCKQEGTIALLLTNKNLLGIFGVKADRYGGNRFMIHGRQNLFVKIRFKIE